MKYTLLFVIIYQFLYKINVFFFFYEFYTDMIAIEIYFLRYRQWFYWEGIRRDAISALF